MKDGNQTLNHIALPPSILKALDDFKKRVWRAKLTEAALLAVFGLVLSYLLVFGLDRFWDTPTIIRVSILGLGSLGWALGLPLKIYRWIWLRRRPEQLARLVREKKPRFGDELLGVVELAQDDSRSGASRRLVEAAMQQMDERLKSQNLSDAAPDSYCRAWGWAAGVPLLLFITLGVLVPDAWSNALWRWAAPWMNVERYTFTQIQTLPGSLVVPYAETHLLEIELNEDSPWRPEIAVARLGLKTVIQAPLEDGRFLMKVPPLTQTLDLFLKVGDVQHSISIDPKLRPELSAIEAEVQLPAYLQRTEVEKLDVRGGSINPVVGSTVVFQATATRELIEATLDGESQPISGASVTTHPVQTESARELELFWKDPFGLTPAKPQILKIEPREDEAPLVGMSQIKNNAILLSTETLSFELQVADDFGIQHIGLEWQGIRDPIQNPDPSEGSRDVANGSPTSTSLNAIATFSAEREGVSPQSLQIRAYATDYFEGRERTYSPYLTLHVLSPSQHMKWLTSQLDQWASASQEVYETELQLNQKNQELAGLPIAVLQTPEYKAALQNQAAAESANAAELNLLIGSGKLIIQEATRNEEFDAAQLENLADMLQQLDEIAKTKMPSVAGLLAQAAAAQAPKPSSPTDPNDPSQDPADSRSSMNQQSGEPSVSSQDEKKEAASDPNAGPDEVKKYGPDEIAKSGAKEGEESEEAGAEKESEEDSDEPKSDDPANVEVNRFKSPQGEEKEEESAEDGKEEEEPETKAPQISDIESGFNPTEKPKEEDQEEDDEEEKAPPPPGALGLPSPVLKGSGNPEGTQEDKEKKESKDKEKEKEKSEPDAAELTAEAVKKQQDLLDAFAKVASEMTELLKSFDESTFVKRLKAASRRQIDLAVDINGLGGFGIAPEQANNTTERQTLADKEIAESKKLLTLLEDMMAYTDRQPSEKFSRVLNEVQQENVIRQVQAISETLLVNNVGYSTIEAEFWADTLDRYAEQLVDPLGADEPSDEDASEEEDDTSETPSLSPEIVLEVIRIINQEIELRESTRELHQIVDLDESSEYRQSAAQLGQTQYALENKTLNVMDRIFLLGNADHPAIQAQVNKLREAAFVMGEAKELLLLPETGPPTIAAISEVLEILLQAVRQPNNPTVSQSKMSSVAALALVGIGDDTLQASIDSRAPEQSTGKAGRKLPEEFQRGLDKYFSVLEGAETDE